MPCRHSTPHKAQVERDGMSHTVYVVARQLHLPQNTMLHQRSLVQPLPVMPAVMCLCVTLVLPVHVCTRHRGIDSKQLKPESLAMSETSSSHQ
jgi:hypothetical protein